MQSTQLDHESMRDSRKLFQISGFYISQFSQLPYYYLHSEGLQCPRQAFSSSWPVSVFSSLDTSWRKCQFNAYVRCRAMAPHPGIDTDQIRLKTQKDLFNLLEGVFDMTCLA